MLLRPSQTLLRHYCLKRQNIEATGTKLASCFDNIASTLLPVSTGLNAGVFHRGEASPVGLLYGVTRFVAEGGRRAVEAAA